MEGTKTNHSDKVLSALLTEMDGMGGKEQDGLCSGQVLVIGATNRPGVLDSALTRPGRLDSHIYIPPPDRLTRMKILETYLNKVPNKGLDLENIAERTENYSGADLENLVKESVLHLLSQEGMDALELKSEHMETVLNLYRPSLPHNLSQYML
ncbi:spermatogenesis-associated protein 5-like protein 1 [Eurytemora carolleeae]|uniref:spermatogenesis-associated protein 5-like protein 1 n=1 Tax=Eurytemora carolleeae TaxID=1294199 RepID=UPI000C777C67|nr:spermatogenesis-associated protein 5-like protein 1 [Eurytemora carolleeae]|eukprot:XP_023349428.1 spermatogenesis-associated protein 5-like protein 1 [Eurytemora affinis]